MKSMNTKDVVRLLNDNGYELYKDSKHKIYKHTNGQIISIPHTREVSPGTLRNVMKLINANKTAA